MKRPNHYTISFTMNWNLLNGIFVFQDDISPTAWKQARFYSQSKKPASQLIGSWFFVILAGSSLYVSRRKIDVRRRRCIHAVPQEEPGMGRLIVSRVLPGNPQPVNRVVHQGVDSAVGRIGGGVNT